MVRTNWARTLGAGARDGDMNRSRTRMRGRRGAFTQENLVSPGPLFKRCSSGRGQVHPEGRPEARLGLHADASLQALQGAADERPPDARPRILLGAIQPLEDAEDPFVVLRGNADAVVLDQDPDAVFAGLAADPDHRLHAGARAP